MPRANRLALRTLSLVVASTCALGIAACRNSGRDRSSASKWLDEPKNGQKNGKTIEFHDLGVKFETPDTLYVYRSCTEPTHTPEGSSKWIPVISCSSVNAETFGQGGDEDGEEDPFANDDAEEASGVETINITFYVTHKTRPLDERAVSWFENEFKHAGLSVDDISYQHDFQKKTGIYAKLHVTEGDSPTPTREIVQFMFPHKDVVFIARMEYPFGETRSVDHDWKYLLWNFDWM